MSLKGRHIVGIADLTRAEMELIFRCADRLGAQPRGQGHLGRGSQLASLFFEPSTRTRLSFESAMNRLGGAVLTVADGAQSSATKGETLADTVRVVSAYVDVIVLRHPWEGAARLAATVSAVPVINAGDGAHEHPTQTLCDLYTLYREHGRIEGLTVTLWGDLKYGRTVHSLALGLAAFGARLVFAPAVKELAPPPHLLARLRDEWGCTPAWWDPAADAPLPPSDALYVTRMQRERFDADGAVPREGQRIDRATLRRWGVPERVTLLHPLPRAGELSPELDGDGRSAYFRQAANGVPVRMATLALLLGVAEEEWASGWGARRRLSGGAASAAPPASFRASGIVCPNASCVANRERAAVEPRFTLARGDDGEGRGLGLHCHYCERPVRTAGIADHAANIYRRPDDPRLLALLAGAPPGGLLLAAIPEGWGDAESLLPDAAEPADLPLGATA